MQTPAIASASSWWKAKCSAKDARVARRSARRNQVENLNLRRGLFRAWVLGSALWLVFAIKYLRQHCDIFFTGWLSECTFSLGLLQSFFGWKLTFLDVAEWCLVPPVVAFTIGFITLFWVVRGFRE
jgi:hypothetical protein